MIRFRSSEDHEDLLKKVKKMRKFTEELEECLEDAENYDDEEWEEEPQYRTGMRNYTSPMRSRYSRRGGMK